MTLRIGPIWPERNSARAYVFVVNKSDRQGAQGLSATIRAALHLGPVEEWWGFPVLLTRADEGQGVEELHRTVLEHRGALVETSRFEARRRERQMREFSALVTNAVSAGVDGLMRRDGRLAGITGRVERGEVDPYTAAREAAAVLPL